MPPIGKDVPNQVLSAMIAKPAGNMPLRKRRSAGKCSPERATTPLRIRAAPIRNTPSTKGMNPMEPPNCSAVSAARWLMASA